MVGRAVFLILIGGWEDFMFQKDKFPGLGNPYNVLEYFLNKNSGSKKTLQKHQYTNGSFKQQPFLKKKEAITDIPRTE